MLSKAKIKWINSLEQKKFRQQYGLFLAEGHKLVGDLLPLMDCRCLVATQNWLSAHPEAKAGEIISVTEDELRQASLQSAPQDVLGVFEIPRPQLDMDDIRRSLSIALDDVQDPGNLGTIIRTADWFGIEHIFCSVGTVDAFNPKVVQATMGAIGRVSIHYVDLAEFLPQTQLPVFGTFLDGEDIYRAKLPACGILLMGNEGKGICPRTAKAVTRRLLIPAFPPDRHGSESLNVSMATAIVCSEFRRRCL